MTRLTRNAATQVFVTVMTDILGVETNSPLSLAMVQVGVQDILDLIGLNFAEIESLTYRPAQLTTTPPLLRLLYLLVNATVSDSSRPG